MIHEHPTRMMCPMPKRNEADGGTSGAAGDLAAWRPGLDPAKLRARRLLLGLTLAELGDRVGKARSYVSDLEHGRRLEQTALNIVARLAYALGLGVEELMTDPPAWATEYQKAVRREANAAARAAGR